MTSMTISPAPAKAGRYRRPSAPVMAEDSLHVAVADYLRVALPIDSVWTTIGHGGGGKARGGQLKAKGVRAGMPDIALFLPGISIWIELKTAIGSLSPDQRSCHAELTALGHRVAICRSVESVEIKLRGWGVPLRATTLGRSPR